MNARLQRCCLLCFLLGGCALTNKADPFQPRYFSPHAEARTATAASGGVARANLELRLEGVRSSEHLRERIAYRPSPRELGYYEGLRWTERPDAFLRRALERELFEERGLQRARRGPGARLEVELLAFEQLRAPRQLARVQVVYVLDGYGGPAVQRTLQAEHPVAEGDDEAAAIVDALAAALATVVDAVADQVVAELARQHREPERPQGQAPVSTTH